MIKLIKAKIIWIMGAIALILIAIFSKGLYFGNLASQSSAPAQNILTEKKNDSPRISTTNPSPLEETIVLPTQSISISFNMPLESIPELRYSIEPALDLKVELSDDKKTVKFTPKKSFELGQGYTLYIKSETKFDGKKTLGPEEKVYHFSTISYRGV